MLLTEPVKNTSNNPLMFFVIVFSKKGNKRLLLFCERPMRGRGISNLVLRFIGFVMRLTYAIGRRETCVRRHY